MANKHFQFLRSTAEYTSFDLAKEALSRKTLFSGEPALAYYAEDGNKKALLAIGGQTSGQIYFYNSDKIEELITAAKNSVNARIDALDLTSVGGTGKVITTISQEDGKVSASAIDLTAANVAYNGKGSILSASTEVEGALEKLQTAVLDNKAAELTYKTRKLNTNELAALTDAANVKEAYKTVSVDKDGNEQEFTGDVIKVYKDSSLSGVTFSDQKLHFTYIKADGTNETVDVDMAELVLDTEVENGIQAIDHKLSIKLDATNEGEFLTVGENGLKLSGVQSAIDTSLASGKTYTDNSIAALDATVSGETTYSTVKIDEANGKLTAVTITDTIGNVSANTEGYAEATDVKAYVDAKVSGKNVTAEGDNYVSASAADNKVTVHANVANLTVGKSGDADSTLAGTVNTLVDGNDLATKVSSFVDARIDEEIKKLDANDTAVADEFVTSVSEADGKISVVRGKVAASGVTAVAIDSVAGEKVAVTGTTVAAQIESLAKSVAVAQEACNIDSNNGAIVVTDGTGKDVHTKIEFKLSTAAATDMLSIETDGLKMSETWDCGTF